MTKEEQLDWLCRLRTDLNNGVIFTPWNKEFAEALEGIIEKEPCSDAISRQWLMKCVNEGWIKFDTEKDANRFIHLVRDMAPPVMAEPKTINAEVKKIDEWDIKGKNAELWIVKGKLQVRYLGTIHNIPLPPITVEPKMGHIED